MPAKLDPAEFYNRCERKPNGCLEWTGPSLKAGYGLWGGRQLAHREAYERAYGPIPEGMHVLHSCDNPPCVDPDHLHLGTNTDNMREAAERHRSANQYGPQLSPEQAKRAAELPREYGAVVALARELGVTRKTVRKYRDLAAA